MSKRESGLDVCPECKVREGDSSEKKLLQCRYCERWFCERHLEPRLAVIRDFNKIIKDKEWRTMVEEGWQREDGHPDYAYTKEKFDELKIEREITWAKINAFLDKSRVYKKPVPKGQKEEFKLLFKEHFVTCPKCGSTRTMTTAYRKEFEAFECLDCHKTWKEPRRTELGIRPSLPIKKIVALLLIITIVGAVLWNAPSILSAFQKITGSQPSTGNKPQNITQPPQTSSPIHTYEELVNYALFLINSDRAAHGLQNVSLSEVDSAQGHADNMLKYNFFSHWDTDGYKPYMRYTLAGGKGAVAENIAAFTQGAPSDLKNALESLEWSMINDDAESNWGHRDNILNAFHNKVSIGVSYGNNQVYFVQDFVDEYVQWTTFSVTQNEVALIGSLSKQMSLSQVDIFYDNPPLTLTKDQLEESPYNGAYTQGTFVGMVVPSGYESTQGITINAETWIQSGLTFQVRFNLTPAFNTHGKGVYTIYLQSNDQASLTSYSIWND